MEQKKIIAEASGFLSKQLGIAPESIDMMMDLKSMGMDSFRIIEFVLFLERKTGLAFPDHAYTPENLKTAETVVACFMKIEK